MALLSNVPVGEYDVKIISPGFSGAQQSVTVTSGNVQELHFALAVAQHQETVEVSGAPETVNPSSSMPQTLVSRGDIAQTPGADRTNSMSMITGLCSWRFHGARPVARARRTPSDLGD